MLTGVNSLNKEEFRKFGEFINSAYFNKFSTIKKLYKHLKKIHPEINNENTSVKNISLSVYNENVPNKDKIRKLISDFKLLLEKFLICNEVLKDNVENRLTGLNVLRKKFLMEMYDTRLDSIRYLKEPEFGSDEAYYINKMKYYDELFRSTFSSNKRIAKQYSEKKLNYLNLYFIYQSLVYYYNFYSVDNTDSAKNSVIMKDFVFKLINKNFRKLKVNNPDIIILYYGSLMYITGEYKYYDMLERYYRVKKTKFDYNLHTLYYFISQNYLKKKSLENPDQDYEMKLFLLRKLMFRNEHFEMFLYEGRTMPGFVFFQIFNDAVKLKEFNWADMFVREMEKFLISKERSEVLNITSLILNYFMGEHSGIYEKINRTGKANIRYFIFSRIIKIMLLYDTGETDAVKFECEAFRKFILRQPKDDIVNLRLYHKSLIFYKWMIFLCRLKLESRSRNKKYLLKIKSGITGLTEYPEYRFWIEEKLNEFSI